MIVRSARAWARWLDSKFVLTTNTQLPDDEVAVSWPEIMRDLGRVQAVIVDLDGQRYRLRTDLAGSAHAAFAAAGVRPPLAVTSLGRAPPAPDLVLGGFSTGPGGSIEITAAVDAGLPPALALHVQWWIADPAGPQGFAASNGVRALTP